MDANGLRFWMLADQSHWKIGGDPPSLRYDRDRRRLRLASRRLLPPPSDSTASIMEGEARSRLEAIPKTCDQFGTRAYWDSEAHAVMATGALPDSVPIYLPPPDQTPTDLTIGFDGVLYLAIGGRVVLQDRRNRWQAVTVGAEGFSAWRLAADPSGGVWVLDRIRRLLGRVEGLPFPDRPYAPPSPNTVRPCVENPDSPRLTVWTDPIAPPNEEPAAIACSPLGEIALLTWTDGDARFRSLKEGVRLSSPVTLNGVRRPYSLAWLERDRLAVLATGIPNEAPVYPIAEGTAHADPVGVLFPLRNHTGEPFAHGLILPPYYPTAGGLAPLAPLSLPSFALQGAGENGLLLDSGSTQTVWHRLYLEGSLPSHCGVNVFLAASDSLSSRPPFSDDSDDWHPHRFGEIFDQNGPPGVPRGAWVSARSEIPYHGGLLDCDPVPGRVGLFTILIQRANRPVRSLRGRYLWVRLELVGDGQTTPEVAALRAYASRFSYLQKYLPEIYQETLAGPDAERIITADQSGSRSDFLERFLDNFEGILTPLEDRIASAYLLTDPRSTPEAALEWLGSWIGMTFESTAPLQRRRRLLEAAPELYRRRGTLRGLQLALEIVTEGAVSRGEVIVLEDYRLRRTFTTILGADLADEEDPLLGGLAVSGNAYVGDTLFLGEETEKEFLALFAADLALTTEEGRTVAAFFDRLAYRVTVFVHQEVTPQDLGLIRKLVAMESPAHIVARVLTASPPLMVGVASLVGLDTYLQKKGTPRPITLGSTQVGWGDLLQHSPSLDPRLDAVADGPGRHCGERPVAAIAPVAPVPFGRSFTLDGSGSRADEEHTVERYRWTLLE